MAWTVHDNDIVHCDLTSVSVIHPVHRDPLNFICQQNNVLIATDGSPRLAGFSMLNITRQSDPEFSFQPGSIRWIAPECLDVMDGETLLSNEATLLRNIKSSDIYSLGCIMLQVLPLIGLLILIDATLQVLYGKVPYWWIKSSEHVFSAKFQKKEPILVDSHLQIRQNHLDFMRQCWSDEREARPSVDDILSYLDGHSFEAPRSHQRSYVQQMPFAQAESNVGISTPAIEKKVR